MVEETTAAQLQAILGPLLELSPQAAAPSDVTGNIPKKPRLEPGLTPRGSGQNRRANGRGSSGGGSTASTSDDIVSLLAKLVLRHEDSLHTIDVDRGFVLFMDLSATEAIAPLLFSASAKWKKARSESGLVTVPLRLVLVQLLLQTAQKRLQLLAKAAENMSKAQGNEKGKGKPPSTAMEVDQRVEDSEAKLLHAAFSRGVLTKELCFPYQMWDAQGYKPTSTPR